MTWHRTIFNRRRSLADGCGILVRSPLQGLISPRAGKIPPADAPKRCCRRRPLLDARPLACRVFRKAMDKLPGLGAVLPTNRTYQARSATVRHALFYAALGCYTPNGVALNSQWFFGRRQAGDTGWVSSRPSQDSANQFRRFLNFPGFRSGGPRPARSEPVLPPGAADHGESCVPGCSGPQHIIDLVATQCWRGCAVTLRHVVRSSAHQMHIICTIEVRPCGP
jgi:hypothetical protein